MDGTDQSLYKRSPDHIDLYYFRFLDGSSTSCMATMPKYVLRLAGRRSFSFLVCQRESAGCSIDRKLSYPVKRKKTALTSMTFGMFIMPISALCMASGNMLDGNTTILGMHPVAFMMVVGIVFQGLAETFISPRFLEYFSLQAPKGEEGYTSVSATFTPSCHLYSDSAYQASC